MDRHVLSQKSQAFGALRELFRGDDLKVRRALEVFGEVTRSDLERLDAAHAVGDWVAVASLMHKMKSACHQLGEATAAEAVAVVETTCMATDGEARSAAYAVAREELAAVQDRVTQYLEARQYGI